MGGLKLVSSTKKESPQRYFLVRGGIGGGDTLRFPFYNRDYIINHFKDPY